MQDSFVHKGKRKILVEYLREKIGISDENVLKAINEVPRHLFLESVFEDFAYEDRAFPIAANQTISHPSTVAEQIGAFRSKTGADNYAADNSSVKGMYKGVVKTYDLGGSPIYRVMLTGFNSEAEARDFIKEGQFPGSFVVSVE
jgi:hypothetical protein